LLGGGLRPLQRWSNNLPEQLRAADKNKKGGNEKRPHPWWLLSLGLPRRVAPCHEKIKSLDAGKKFGRKDL
jgi:hypothetical protein